MKTQVELEKRLVELNELCARTTGLESYPTNNIRRQAVLDDLKELRPLTRIEYINLYSYDAWRTYVKYHALPENHPTADLPCPTPMQIKVKLVRDNLPTLEGRDAESTDRLIEQLFEDGWWVEPILKFCRCTEEVNPELDEDIALKRMKLIRDSVNKELGRPEIYTPKGMVRKEGAN